MISLQYNRAIHANRRELLEVIVPVELVALDFRYRIEFNPTNRKTPNNLSKNYVLMVKIWGGDYQRAEVPDGAER